MSRDSAIVLFGLTTAGIGLGQIPMYVCYAPSGTCTPPSGQGWCAAGMQYCDNGWGLAPPGWAGRQGPLDPTSVPRYCCTVTEWNHPTAAPCSWDAEDSPWRNTGCAIGGGGQPQVCCFILWFPNLLTNCTQTGNKLEPYGGPCRGEDN